MNFLKKYKKNITFILLLSFIQLNFMPLSCFSREKTDKSIIKTGITKEKKTFFHKKNNVENENSTFSLNIDFWNNYDDEYLSGYVEKALSNNRDLKIATLKVEQSYQMMKVQLANELPSLNVGVSPGGIKLPNTTNFDGFFSIPIIANYEIDLFLKNHDKTKSAKKSYEMSLYDKQAAYLAILSQVGTCYFNIVKLDKLISLQNEIINKRKNIYDLMKMKHNEGLSSTSDLVNAEKAYINSTVDLIDLKKSRELALNSFAVLIGESPENINEFKRISYDKLKNEYKIPEFIVSDAIENRPDYLKAQKNVEKSGIDVKVAKKEFLPSFNIIGLLGFQTGSMYSSMNWKTALAGLVGSGMVSLFSGGRKIANLKLNKNVYEQTVQNYYKTNLVAIQEVNDALCSLKLDNQKFEKNTLTYNMEQKDFGFTKNKFNEGVISKLDVLQKEDVLLSVKKLVVSSKIDVISSEISLYKALGGKV